MQKLGILLLGTILLGGFSTAQADSWHGNKHSAASKGDRGRDAAVYGSGHHQKPNVGRNITYGSQHSKQKHVHSQHMKKKHVHKARPSSKQHAPKVVYVTPKHASYYKKPYHKAYRPTYVYVKPVYVPRYYGYHPYRGYYWPFVNMRFIVDLTSRQIEHHHHAVYSALDAPVGHVARWSDGGGTGFIVILRDGYDAYGNLCKQYRQTLTYRGRTRSSVEMSCLSPEGHWISV
ncbi:hypothetical protein [uncultured Sneathiella sp.]|jgi:hypothetical protein|uniref:hypothetical protein n=1 Tax=uncultured Sneathiella sp. TaxID=879315 RepID=UPI0025986C19|nr:hypothetical protein [uncultured Sneathiella sp.]